MLLDRVIGDFTDKTQCTLGANHQMLQDVEGVCEVNQCVQGVASGVFQSVLMADALGEHCVGTSLMTQAFQCVQQTPVAVSERTD